MFETLKPICIVLSVVSIQCILLSEVVYVVVSFDMCYRFYKFEHDVNVVSICCLLSAGHVKPTRFSTHTTTLMVWSCHVAC